MTPTEVSPIYHAIADKGPWGLSVFLIIVMIYAYYQTFKYFTSFIDKKDQSHATAMDKKDEMILGFQGVIDRQTDAFNRRTNAENHRTELELLQMAARNDISPELKNRAAEAVKRIKDDSGTSG